MERCTVVIAESQTLFRDMITSFVEDMDDLRVIGTFKDGEEVLQFINKVEVRPSLVLLDIHMPMMDGLECAKRLRVIHPEIKIVLLSAYDDEESIESVLSVAADGYILKSASLDEFKETLQFIVNGKFVAPQNLIKTFSRRLTQLIKLEQENSIFYLKEQLHNSQHINKREWDIIHLLKRGWTNRMIAEKLHISEGTVKNYLSIIYKKLEIRNREDLLRLLTDMAN